MQSACGKGCIGPNGPNGDVVPAHGGRCEKTREDKWVEARLAKRYYAMPEDNRLRDAGKANHRRHHPCIVGAETGVVRASLMALRQTRPSISRATTSRRTQELWNADFRAPYTNWRHIPY